MLEELLRNKINDIINNSIQFSLDDIAILSNRDELYKFKIKNNIRELNTNRNLEDIVDDVRSGSITACMEYCVVHNIILRGVCSEVFDLI